PFLLLVLLALGLPALAQDANSEAMMTSADGWITYSAPDCEYGGEFQSIEAVDASTVVFHLCFPDGSFPAKAAFASFQIRPYAQLQATGGSGDLLTNPIGTGPWKFDHWEQGTEIVFTRNEDYWGEKAKEEQLILQWNPEAAARLTQLQAGSVDGIDNVGATDFETIQNDSTLQLLPVPGLNVLYLGINNTMAPFDNIKVRQALAYGIDKQRIVDNFYPVGSLAADQFMPDGIFGYTTDFATTAFDPAMARQLLEEAAAEDGFTLPINVNLSYRPPTRGYFPQPPQIAADVQQQLNDIGFNITLDQQESTTFLDNASAGSLPLFLLGWGADYPDATNFLDYHFGAGANDSFGNKFPDIIDLLAQGSQQSDPDERLATYAEANLAIQNEVPMVAIAHGSSGVAFKASLEGANTSPLNNITFANIEDPADDNIIFLQNGEPGSLYCSDETDGESLRPCMQTNESLLAYEVGGTAVVPSLAESYEASDDGLTWTFHLRAGVMFHDGSELTANDAVMSYAIPWDAANPLHVGRTGNFDYFSSLFGGFLNPPAAE
ncbi:MAG: ABC transporter substrate-binding protein, partial [Chloroflexota bacterium]